MKLAEWLELPMERQSELCQKLNPYDQWDLFKGVEERFTSEFGRQLGIEKVFCGLASGVGPVNAITVKIKRGEKPTRLPEKYLGFPVLRSYEKGKGT